MEYNSSYMMGGMHGLWWLFWLVLLAVFLFAGWGSLGGRRHRVTELPRDTPHELLHRRLASGEITAADYEERKSLLDRDAGPGYGKT